MKLLQYTGPFIKDQRIVVPAQAGYTYVHIGIEMPNTQPFIIPTGNTEEPFYEYVSDRVRRLSINGKDYIMNPSDILEFDGLSEIEWVIQFKTGFPKETIVDIVRKT